MPTFLVNHQLHNETMHAISLRPDKDSYSLDVLLLNEGFLWKTWLHRSLTKRIATVSVSFRIHGTSTSRNDIFREGCGGPPYATWYFYKHLTSFFDYESPDYSSAPTHTNDKRVQISELSFLTPDPSRWTIAPEGAGYDENRHHGYRIVQYRGRDGTDFALSPRFLLKFFKRDINMMLVMGYNEAQYGAFV